MVEVTMSVDEYLELKRLHRPQAEAMEPFPYYKYKYKKYGYYRAESDVEKVEST